MRIYLSSTSVDLKHYRESALAALRRMGHEAAAMEDYGAEDQFPADKCVADVQASELYVGVFAWRYGFVPADRQVSITEMEFLAAKEKGIPTLIFVLDPEVPWPPKHIDRGENAGRIEALRDRLMKGHLVSMFASPEDLAAKVATAVARIGAAEGKKGPAKAAASWTIAQLRERAQKASAEYCEKMQRQRIFLPQVYVQRAELEGHLDGFVDPRCSKTGLVVVGASGTGKTNTLCHWVLRYQQNEARSSDVVLFLGGSTLPGGHFDLRQSILERLDVTGSMPDFHAAFAAQRGDKDSQFLIVIDSVDKHPQAGELMRQIDDLIVLEEVVPWYKIIISIAEVPYASLRNGGFLPNERDYYAAPAPAAGAASAGEVLEVRLGLLSPQELMTAYDSYRKEPGFTPASTYGELTDEVRLSLRKPLVLRMVMELFNERKVPERVLGTEVLFEYCTKKIFRHPDRAFFVNRLVDLLYDHHLTSASFDTVAREPDLRAALLNLAADTCYPQLLDEQVLEEQTKKVSSILPSQKSIAFTYDRLLEYLLLARLAERFGMHPDALVKLSKEAASYLPLHGVLTTLMITKVEEGRPDEAAAVFRAGEPEVMRSLARRVFSELEHMRPMPEAAAADEGPLGKLVAAMVKEPSHFTVELLLEAAGELCDLGHLRRAESIYESLAPVLPADLERRLKGAFFRGRGLAKSLLGHSKDALTELESALEHCREAKDRNGEQMLLDDIGELQLELGHMKEAHAALTASLAIDRELLALPGAGAEAREGEAESLYGLSCFYLLDGRLDEADRHAEESLKIRRELGGRRAVAESVLQAGKCQSLRGEPEKALVSAGEALAIYREAGSKAGIAACLTVLGTAHGEMGRAVEAANSLREALHLLRSIGSVRRAAGVLTALGRLARSSGEHDTAMRRYVEALELRRASGDEDAGAAVLCDIAATHLLAGRPEAAVERLKEALAAAPDERALLAALAKALKGSAKEGAAEEAVRLARGGSKSPAGAAA